MIILFFIILFPLKSLSPSSFLSSNSFCLDCHNFEEQSIEDLANNLEQSVDDIPLYLGSFNSEGFRDQVQYHLPRLKQKDPRSALFFFQLFNRLPFIAESFHYQLMRNKEFVSLLDHYESFKDILKSICQQRNISLQPHHLRDAMTTLLSCSNLIVIKNDLEQLPSSCHDVLDALQVLFFLRTQPFIQVPFSLLESTFSFLKAWDLLNTNRGTQENALYILYQYDLAQNKQSGLHSFLLQEIQSYKSKRFIGYQQDLLQTAPLRLFALDVIERHYQEKGYQTLLDVFVELQTDSYGTTIQYLIKYQPDPQLLLKKLNNLVAFSESFCLYLLTRVSYSDLSEEFIQKIANRLLRYGYKEYFELWKNKSSSPLNHQDLLLHLTTMSNLIQHSQAISTKLLEIISLSSPQEISQFLLCIKDSFFSLFTHDKNLSYTLLYYFPLPQESPLHRGIKSILNQPLEFKLDQLPYPPWIGLKNVTLLGRTIYGFSSRNNQWLAYKFLKKGESHQELIQGELIQQQINQHCQQLSSQKPMGLWKNQALSSSLLKQNFPNHIQNIDLYQFEPDGSIVYRLYAVNNSDIFHYPYEPHLSFKQSTEGIHLLLKQAGQFWQQKCYLTSTASPYHNTIESRRYLTGTAFLPYLGLGKLHSWNEKATDYCDFRVGGIADTEDLTLQVDPQWIQTVQNSLNFRSFDCDIAFSEPFLAVNTLCDLLLLADLLTFRKYFSLIDQHITVSLDELQTAIQNNYIELFKSISSCSHKEALEIFNNSILFPWKKYIQESLQEMTVSPQRYIDQENYLILYTKGLTPSGSFKDSLSSKGDNLGGFNDPYPIPTLSQLFYSFILSFYRYRLTYSHTTLLNSSDDEMETSCSEDDDNEMLTPPCSPFDSSDDEMETSCSEDDDNEMFTPPCSPFDSSDDEMKPLCFEPFTLRKRPLSSDSLNPSFFTKYSCQYFA